ncbi:MAG TPA: hypothetical protein PLT68_05640, partial [Actinomycetota bacterium]|nr:hypothetical protein [Actinomycetota bacterium]
SQESPSQESPSQTQEVGGGILMADPEKIADMVEQVAQTEGDRYSRLVDIHDALRDALAETDGGPAATGR